MTELVPDHANARTESCWVCRERGPFTNPRIRGNTVVVDVCGTCGGTGELVVTPMVRAAEPREPDGHV